MGQAGVTGAPGRAGHPGADGADPKAAKWLVYLAMASVIAFIIVTVLYVNEARNATTAAEESARVQAALAEQQLSEADSREASRAIIARLDEKADCNILINITNATLLPNETAEQGIMRVCGPFTPLPDLLSPPPPATPTPSGSETTNQTSGPVDGTGSRPPQPTVAAATQPPTGAAPAAPVVSPAPVPPAAPPASAGTTGPIQGALEAVDELLCTTLPTAC